MQGIEDVKAEAASTARLWADFTRTRSLEMRNELVMKYVGLVRSIALRLVPTYRKHVDFDDLMSSGLLGLMDAIDKFDITKDVKFETYASLRVKGEIIDQIRKQDWAPISLRQKIKRVEECFENLESSMGRTPTESEVASRLSMSADDVKKTLDEAHTFNLVALDEMLMDRVAGDSLAASPDESPEKCLEEQEIRSVLAKTIEALPDKEKQVVSMYYYDELTLKEIGLVLGVTESRVSQIHSKALMTLRTKMRKAFL
ncbi:MAG: FliA/WhiG family RNA polymerase sigma factor [Oscillospiraceae bacterium]|jgi:RNA polymerase sigma factor for flagellar operon FliA|nr:FliA/WhiG family RNA polymerase sigma factor [Oscillospiraceae bacterium]